MPFTESMKLIRGKKHPTIMTNVMDVAARLLKQMSCGFVPSNRSEFFVSRTRDENPESYKYVFVNGIIPAVTRLVETKIGCRLATACS